MAKEYIWHSYYALLILEETTLGYYSFFYLLSVRLFSTFNDIIYKLNCIDAFSAMFPL